MWCGPAAAAAAGNSRTDPIPWSNKRTKHGTTCERWHYTRHRGAKAAWQYVARTCRLPRRPGARRSRAGVLTPEGPCGWRTESTGAGPLADLFGAEPLRMVLEPVIVASVRACAGTLEPRVAFAPAPTSCWPASSTVRDSRQRWLPRAHTLQRRGNGDTCAAASAGRVGPRLALSPACLQTLQRWGAALVRRVVRWLLTLHRRG